MLLLSNIDWIAIAVLSGIVIVFLGMLYKILRDPLFWADVVKEIFKVLLPAFLFYFKRNTPEVEDRMLKCIRSGGKWNNFKKRCE